jgi:hypothetical protein
MTLNYILHIHVTMMPYFIMLHFINKLAFIILLEAVDSGIFFCTILFSVLNINTGYEDDEYQDFPDG